VRSKWWRAGSPSAAFPSYVNPEPRQATRCAGGARADPALPEDKPKFGRASPMTGESSRAPKHHPQRGLRSRVLDAGAGAAGPSAVRAAVRQGHGLAALRAEQLRQAYSSMHCAALPISTRIARSTGPAGAGLLAESIGDDRGQDCLTIDTCRRGRIGPASVRSTSAS